LPSGGSGRAKGMAATVRISKICNSVSRNNSLRRLRELSVHHLIFNKEVRFRSRLFIHLQATKALTSNLADSLEGTISD